jgi:hypothetical protein
MYSSEEVSVELDQLMDETLFKSPIYSKPYEYLCATLLNQPFHKTPKQCIEILLQSVSFVCLE